MDRFVSMVFALCMSFLLLVPFGVYASEHYVRSVPQGTQDGSSWTDAWDISLINWAQVNSELSSEDVYLYFKRGDVFGKLDILGNGAYVPSGTNRLYLTAQPGDTGPKPRFERHLTGWGYIIGWKNAGYITIDNFDIEDTGYDVTNEKDYRPTSGITTWDGGSCATEPKNLCGKGDIHITNCDFRGFSWMAISVVNSGDNIVISGNTFTNCGNAIYFIDEGSNGGSYHYIADNTCSNIFGNVHSDGITYDGHCIGLQRVDWSIIENNTCTDHCRAPIVLWIGNGAANDGSHNVFRNNRINSSEYSGMVIAGSDIGSQSENCDNNLIYQNMISNAGSRQYRSGFEFTHYTGTSGNRFFNNVIFNAGQEGVGTTKGADNNIVWNNIIHIQDGAVYFVDHSDGVNKGAPPGNNNKFNHNLYSEDRANSWTWMGGTGDFSWWKQQSANNDPDSPQPADSLLTDPGNNDFTPQKDSPATGAGGYLSFVDYSGSGTQTAKTIIKVNDPNWFHGNYGIRKSDGTLVEGMAVSFYDTANGRQDAEVTSVDYDNALITVSPAVDYIYDSSFQQDTDKNTQVSLRFSGTRPDIGAIEYIGSCTPSWICTPWSCSACTDNQQDCTRACTDGNSCGTEEGKPKETDTRACGTGGPVGHWTMDQSDISSGNVLDISGSGNDGTMHGSPLSVAGRVGEALSFDGLDDYIDCGSDTSLDTNGMTVLAWIKPSSAGEGGPNAAVAAKAEDDPPDWSWQIRYNAPGGGNYMGFQVRDTVNTSHWISVGQAIAPDTWHHIAVTFDGLSINMYLDGQETESKPVSGIKPSASSFLIGNDGWDNIFSGTIDDVRVYSYALSPQDIFRIANPHKADTSQDGCIDPQELTSFIGLWYEDSTTNTMPELMEAISLYNAGTGCPS